MVLYTACNAHTSLMPRLSPLARNGDTTGILGPSGSPKSYKLASFLGSSECEIEVVHAERAWYFFPPGSPCVYISCSAAWKPGNETNL